MRGLLFAYLPLLVRRAAGFVAPAPICARRAHDTRVLMASASVEVETQQYLLDGKAIGGPLLPLSNAVLVKVADKQSISSGGIILSAKSQERPNVGIVIAMGPGKQHPETGRKIAMPCAVGDRVLYGKFDGTKINYQRKDHQFIRDDDVLFVYSGDEMTVDSIKMIRDQILVKILDDDDCTTGGLLLAPADPENSIGRKPTTGEIVAIGPGAQTPEGEHIELTLQPGDLVKFRDFAGTEVTMKGTLYRVMRQGDVLVKW